MISYLSDKETVPHILNILDLFKQDKDDEVIEIILKNNIDPAYSDNIISDYAALWLREPLLVPFFEKIKKIGGEPSTHDSIMKNCLQNNKNESVKYLIEQNVLNNCSNGIVYFINVAIMGENLIGVKELGNHVDLEKYFLSNEENPSCVNVAIFYGKKDIVEYLFEKEIMQKYLFKEETAIKLSQSDNEFNKYFFDKICKHFEIPNDNYFFEKETENTYEKITLILKEIEYSILNKELNMSPNLKIKRSKI